MWHTSTPAGWRYFPVILERRDDVMEPKKHGWVMEKGEPREYPKGRYVLQSYVEGRYETAWTLPPYNGYAGHSDLASTMRYLRPESAVETQDRISAIVWE